MLDFPRLFFTPITKIKLLSKKKPLFSANTKFNVGNDGYKQLADNSLQMGKPNEKKILSMPIVPFNSPVVTPSSSFMGITLSRRSISIHSHVRASFPTASAELHRSDSFNLSLESETSNSEEDTDAAALASLEVTLLQPHKWNECSEDLAEKERACGLGIKGMTRKDGSASFDGLGILSIGASTPSPTSLTFSIDQHIVTQSENPFDHPSDTLLQETLVTFMDGQDRDQLLQTISECPWREEEERDLPTKSSADSLVGVGELEESGVCPLKSYPSWPPLLFSSSLHLGVTFREMSENQNFDLTKKIEN
ncbi:hypothetical protein CVT24_012936 [Panaeolus cyanescens]|uniref:Uncharacterized protein n=1 Tax=Panaeolus cyanescens TaxID=181874 RepID=A0A409W6G1_9AGAR|nr:hypothetical protein CVT24_012936 [Panaeolus cyanescens]